MIALHLLPSNIHKEEGSRLSGDAYVGENAGNSSRCVNSADERAYDSNIAEYHPGSSSLITRSHAVIAIKASDKKKISITPQDVFVMRRNKLDVRVPKKSLRVGLSVPGVPQISFVHTYHY
jgi:hypothetical protein